MTTLTTDFTGTYDFPAEEAGIVVESMIDCLECGYSRDEMVALVAKEKAHWIAVFGNDDQGREDLARFIEVFNSEFGTRQNLAM